MIRLITPPWAAIHLEFFIDELHIVLPTTEIADEFQRRTQILIDSTKKNNIQSYLKDKEKYDRKAKAAP